MAEDPVQITVDRGAGVAAILDAIAAAGVPTGMDGLSAVLEDDLMTYLKCARDAARTADGSAASAFSLTATRIFGMRQELRGQGTDIGEVAAWAAAMTGDVSAVVRQAVESVGVDEVRRLVEEG